MAELNGRAAVAVSAGILFVWSGIKGWSIMGTLTDLVTGVKPQGSVKALTTLDPGDQGITSAGGGDVVSTAMQGLGHAYRFGGAPGLDGSRPWDCSSFVNFVVGIKLGRAIPGYGAGKYRGDVHGPPTGMWAVWNGLQRVSRNNVGPGDIIVWPGHMGIATSNSQLISALNPREGTKITKIEGTAPGPILMTGRLR